MRAFHLTPLVIVLLLFTAACANATLDAPTPTFDLSGLPTVTASPSSEAVASETSEPAPSAGVPFNPAGLKVAYSQNGNVWFWSEATPTRQLTFEGDAGSVNVSDDGKVIVFQRAQTLWAINNDGSNSRQLVDVPAFTGRTYLAQFGFQPNSHILYFSGRDSVQSNIGLDLHRVDTDTSVPAPQTLLQEGGVFTFSPDGSLLAFAQPNRIVILRVVSPATLSALDFKQVNTNSDWFYYPQVVWLDNSTGFYTVIPGENIGDKSRFLYVSADGAYTAQLAEFIMADLRVGQPLIAPNGSKVAYVTLNDSTFNIHVIDASTADVIVASHTDSPLIGLWAWSPDSARFAYHTGDPSRLLLTGINLPSAPLLDSFTSYSFTWVDANRFLYFAGGELRLGQVGNPLLTVVASGFPDSTGTLGSYDFAP